MGTLVDALPFPLVVVAHDAGGAEILSSYVRQEGIDCIYSLEGPAIKVFERKLGNIHGLPLEQAISMGGSLLCGTGWQSDFEWRAIKLAKECGKPSAAFLDHWTNYRERFIRQGEICLPDEVWVGDEQARLLVRHALPEVKIKFVANPYFEDIRRELGKVSVSADSGKKGVQILFVSEPLREHGWRKFGDERYWGYTEEEGLRYLMASLSCLGLSNCHVLIRPHPSEPPHKYDWAVRAFAAPVSIGGDRSLLEEIVASDIVAGFQSMALVVGLLAGKRVVSCIPPGGRTGRLPHPEIEHLQAICTPGSN